MMRLFRYALLALVTILVVAIPLAYLALRDGLAADRPPGRVETAIARRLVTLSIPRSTRERSNPHASDPRAWRAGAEHFADHCAVCHGADGRGASPIGPKMYPPVPDLTADEIQRMSDGALFAIIQHGVRWTGMPAFRSEHSDDETWDLVSFIRHLPDLKPAESHAHAHGAEPDDAPRSGARTIVMDGTTFTPSELTVEAGETVTWINKDPFPHNVTSTAGGFTSGDLDPDRRWQFRATTAGRFSYVCTLHPGMRGTLIVKPQ